ncbi:lysine-sensitive aspartokinase 3 [Pantoea sp. Mhis]|uniref:lysine-sensitive aspartokinase 3 n=1 Tax=Pantoea sp. Mhis TaxID=2576759 RepID=UPI00135C5953|nr:lysine-sensitive aspartokinase 3 [Pantoea sp. Mhis]MXP56578.1 lysine-sensitive aspartokinase 3 [Pantoea sp. Mhis]
MSQTLIVAKFGGTSVADFDSMNCSADILLADKNVRLIVLSASAGITNLLISLSEGQEQVQRDYMLSEIRRVQYAIIERLLSSKNIQHKIDNMLNNIIMLSNTAVLTKSCVLTDELISHGELMSTMLFVEILRERQINATWFDVRQVMRTTDRFGNAEPNIIELKRQANILLQPLLQETLVVTQGFIGIESKGRTTTLGRGGSDYTAALLGEALQAIRVDIWTDVAGIYTTDPRIVPEAKLIEEMTFNEAAEMANFGAKVLHPAALLPAVRSAIPVFVGSGKNLNSGGTRVCNIIKNPPLFRALTLRRGQVLVTLHSLNMMDTQSFLARIFNILAQHNISVDLITTCDMSVALTLDATYSTCSGKKLLSKVLLNDLSLLCRIEIEENLALVAIIGNNLSKACGVGKIVFDALDSFNFRMICYGASNYNLCILVSTDSAEEVVRSLHKKLFGS